MSGPDMTGVPPEEALDAAAAWCVRLAEGELSPAEQAELDARLAESKVLTQKSKDQLGELDKSLKRLRKQLGETD